MEHRHATDLGRAAVSAGTIGNILAITNSASILLIGPPGSAIRPMYLPIFLIMIAIGTSFITIPLAISALLQSRQAAMGMVGTLLGLSPLFVGYFAFLAIIKAFGYTLKD